MKKLIVPSALICAATVLIVAVVWGRSSARQEIHYPYICRDCGVVFDVSELKTDESKWRIPPEAPNDSVVFCLRCNKGWAYPVATCGVCKTQYILHMTSDSRCPKCFPEAAQEAQKAGIDILYKGPRTASTRPATGSSSPS